MAVTRDPDFPQAPAQLMQAFNQCADGHSIPDVVEAAGQFMSAALHNYARLNGMTKDQALALFKDVLHNVYRSAEDNWQRKPQPGDVEVRSN
jgi:hypothetical protein